jgi:hypothetical protein
MGSLGPGGMYTTTLIIPHPFPLTQTQTLGAVRTWVPDSSPAGGADGGQDYGVAVELSQSRVVTLVFTGGNTDADVDQVCDALAAIAERCAASPGQRCI